MGGDPLALRGNQYRVRSAHQVPAVQAAAKGELFASSIENGTVTLTVGDLEHCSAGSLVKALKEAGICEGWTDLRIVRERVGRWDSQSAAMRPLI